MFGDMWIMNAKLRDKLHWAFQLYDRDSSGAIDIQEMIKVHWILHREQWVSKNQVFATIYETEGLEHHMAVERAHVSKLPQGPVRLLYVNLIVSFISSSQSIFGKLDVDHDGDITEDEFIQVFHSHLSFFGNQN